MDTIQVGKFAVALPDQQTDQTDGVSGDGAAASEKKNDQSELSSGKSRALPLLSLKKPAKEDDAKLFWKELRDFFRTGRKGGILDSNGRPLFYPALLAPYRDVSRLRFDYPYWIADPTVPAGEDGIEHQSVADLLSGTLGKMSPAADDARILKDNLDLLEESVREKTGKEPTDFRPVLDAALKEMEKRLAIGGEEGKVFAEDVKKFGGLLPTTGAVIRFSFQAPFYLLAYALRIHQQKNREQVLNDNFSVICRLRDLVSVEEQKTGQSEEPENLRKSYDFADNLINFGGFSSVLPGSASEAMSPERLRRIRQVLAVLENAETTLFAKNAVVITDKDPESELPDLAGIFSGCRIEKVQRGKCFSRGSDLFEKHMAAVAEVIAAMRIAILEINHQYVDEIHDDFFQRFDWRYFTEDELAICPPVIIIDDVSTILKSSLSDFSRLLSSNKPVKILAFKGDLDFRFDLGSDDEPVFHQELGALAVSHRNTFALQASSISPSNLVSGFAAGLKAATPALYYVLSPAEKPGRISDPFLWAAAAVEGREFPEFTYDSSKGRKFGSRFYVATNPQVEQDWPIYELAYTGDDGKTGTIKPAFTFVDFAAQDLGHGDLFKQVPGEYWNDDLVPLSEYLLLDPEQAYANIPFIWMIDEKNELQKVVPAYDLVQACEERLDFWHYVQEFGGINSYHVEQAVTKALEDLSAEMAAEIAAIKDEHRKEIEEVRAKTASEAMEKLSSILLDMDTLSLDTIVIPVGDEQKAETVPAEPKPASEEKEAAPEVEEEESLSLDEPWIETFRCTSCNECTNINPNLFKYNGDKQAYINDVTAGTFAQMVQAAEKCPAKCIHPGKPVNPNEPGLDQWIKRAEAFS